MSATSAEFVNEPLLELRRAEVRTAATAALAALDAQLPLEVPMLIGTELVGGEVFASVDPGAPERVVARAHAATVGHVDAAVGRAVDGQRAWSLRSASERAAVLRDAATLLRDRRLELAALAVRECGKPWPEADGDVCEAIDFLEYYAAGAEALDRGRALIQLPGERNTMRYVPRGVTAVIAPWNFPLAIAAGMTSAALATGNAVILKPAEQAPACAKAVVDALHAAGVPHDALSLLPGGDEPGRALVADPRVHTIVFTGSCAAGLSILERAATVQDNQFHIKKVIAEMGGKNVVIVDADADLDDVVPALLSSAFGFAGQKCSAASRVLVHAQVADALAQRLSGAIRTLQVGPADDFATDVGPVIDAEAQQRVGRYVAKGTATAAHVATAGDSLPTGDGFYVAPALLVGLADAHPVIQDEIFGPVLALQSVASIEEACERVDASRFALTGGLFSRSPRTVERVSERTPVGNLYVNREITGAMVGRQPFGGGRLSGTGPKAGGPDYLVQFVEARTVTENTVRHGLVV
ncbi:aldehyde dehydrogenase family protein [Baekduia sp.]|jgi:RHH-type proline utilization regulon transcriptional repressor/proline dehydrogenase/delta 1-pyrroline-5-carboxylate dehydrogenase|uniref:aldehyde dehydrogenase family protein n=1 Tax=Baekduia sp. TaxID=2600305 RepID=UPI002E02186F|nr:aldehyde dehydrogenase family protein [Baekduia sp.]